MLFIKKFLYAAALFIGTTTLFAGADNALLRQAKSYILYYGVVGEAEMKVFSAYDVVIIDPQAMGGGARENIEKLKKQGKLVIGYLSCMEVADFHRYAKEVKPDWYLKVDGKLWQPWGSNYAADLNRKEFRDLLVNKLVKSEVLDYGCDGMFMDTLADIENPALSEPQRRAQLVGLDKLLAELRQAHPKLVLVGNWTIGATLPTVAKYVDIVCWENFQGSYFQKDSPHYSFAVGVRDNLAELQKKHPFRVFALWASKNYYGLLQDRRKTNDLATRLGYLFYGCFDDYHTSITD